MTNKYRIIAKPDDGLKSGVEYIAQKRFLFIWFRHYPKHTEYDRVSKPKRAAYTDCAELIAELKYSIEIQKKISKKKEVIWSANL